MSIKRPFSLIVLNAGLTVLSPAFAGENPPAFCDTLFNNLAAAQGLGSASSPATGVEANRLNTWQADGYADRSLVRRSGASQIRVEESAWKDPEKPAIVYHQLNFSLSYAGNILLSSLTARLNERCQVTGYYSHTNATDGDGVFDRSVDMRSFLASNAIYKQTIGAIGEHARTEAHEAAYAEFQARSGLKGPAEMKFYLYRQFAKDLGLASVSK